MFLVEFFSNAIQNIIAESDGHLINRKLVFKARKFLKTKGLDQQPGIYCNDDLVNALLLC